MKMKPKGRGPHSRTCGKPDTLFWAKVNKTATCWLYTGFIKWDGYGWLCRRGRYMTAHRHSWQLAHGQVADGLQVLHKCDVPACCNPEHLFLGTYQDNHADKVAKRRHVYGERNWQAKLTVETVAQIRAEYLFEWRGGRRWSNAKELAARYGVQAGCITSVISGRHWKINQPAPILHPDRVRPRKS